MTPCTCDKWREVKAAFDEKPLFKFEAMVKRQEWTCCPWCGCLLIPLIDPKTALSGSEKPMEEAEWRVKHERLKFLEDSFELCDCRAEDQFVCPRCEEIKALENEFDSIRPKRPLPTQPKE